MDGSERTRATLMGLMGKTLALSTFSKLATTEPGEFDWRLANVTSSLLGMPSYNHWVPLAAYCTSKKLPHSVIWPKFLLLARTALANIDKMFHEAFLTKGYAWKSLCAVPCSLHIKRVP